MGTDKKSEHYQRTLITAALPYANGPVHIGHLAGVYIPADIYSRYLRVKGQEVLYVCGSDEHGVPITLKAQQQGCSPQDIVDKYHAMIKKSFEDFGIQFDIYSRTSSKMHHQTSADFFTTLYKKNCFIEQTSEQFYDTEAHQFLADRYIVGTCPRCNFENAYGDQCEKCGATLSPLELINPRSAISGSKPILKPTKHWYLPLDQYQQWLHDWIIEEHKEWKTNVYGQCKSWLDAGLLPRAVSRDLNWGVPVPLDDAEGKVLYVWFDAPIGYISNTKELLPQTWEKWWKDDTTRLLHFIGKDNIVFHCIVFPVMLKAHGEYILPENVPANEFLNLEGEKISTSRNWAVWLHEYLEDFKGQEDVLRYVLTSNMPETKDNDFTWKDFQTKNNSELVANLGNFVNRVMVLTHKYCKGKIPPLHELSVMENDIMATVQNLKVQIEQNIEHFHFREALKNVMEISRIGNKYLTDTEPWKLAQTDMVKVETILHLCIQIIANLSIVFQPFLPSTAKKMAAMLNIKAFSWSNLGSFNLLQQEHQLGEPTLLFSKIEDDCIAHQIAKLQSTKSINATTPTLPTVSPQKPNIDFDTFQKNDLRVVKILTANRVDKSKKLLKFTVDLGFEQRTVLSGVAEHITPEELIGKRLPMIINLPERNIMGHSSQGMLLYTEDSQGKLQPIIIDETIELGATIS